MEQQNLRELLALKLKLMRVRRKKLAFLALLELENPARAYPRNLLRKHSSLGEFSILVSELNSEPQDFFIFK